jgi:2-polyprenyl-3-methyl-5-hydroxy-6-metoxy-1,4-benzoquinol methylase
MSEHIDPIAAPRVAALDAVLREKYGFFKDAVDRTAAEFGPQWTAAFEETLAKLFPDDGRLAKAAEGYARFVMDLLRRQRRFERERVYPAKTYAAAAAEVYMDDDYMTRQYLPGLLLAHFLWPHHVRHAAFFETAFVGPMRLAADTRFAEVGVGTGLYSREVLMQLGTARGVGLDISPASAAFTKRHVEAFAVDDRYEMRLQDVVDEPLDEPVPWLICIEVLEHLEDPVTFLGALRASLAPGGRAFVTAALTAAHVDHIHLYETVDDVIAESADAGFVVEQAFLANAHPPTSLGTPVPAVAALILL